MRPLVVSPALVGVLLLGVSAVVGAQGPTGDSVKGHQFDIPYSFDIDAFSGPSGENPSGVISVHLGGGNGTTYRLAVTCLSVTGNQAIIGVSGTVGGSLGQGTGGLMRVGDNGGLGSGLDTLALALEFRQGPPDPTPLPGPTTCSEFPTGSGPLQTTSLGDIVVTDAQPPLPTTKNQCKNGGWRHYGSTFKNEGQCVAFVQRGPKP
jgi:hypothetical protein